MKAILLIENNFDFLENLTEYLKMEGYEVFMADNGNKGVELARELIPDLIICDILMPEMDGHKVLCLLLEMAKTATIPFIFSSSLSEEIDKSIALKLGADDYIVKPYELEIIGKLVKQRIKSGSKRANYPIMLGNLLPT